MTTTPLNRPRMPAKAPETRRTAKGRTCPRSPSVKACFLPSCRGCHRFSLKGQEYISVPSYCFNQTIKVRRLAFCD